MCFAGAYHITLVGAQHTGLGIQYMQKRARLAFILICGGGPICTLAQKTGTVIYAYLCHLRCLPLWISIMAEKDAMSMAQRM